MPGGTSGKNLPLDAEDIETWVGKIPWRRVWQSTLVFLPGESHGQRSLAGYSPSDPLEKPMATHSSVLAWRIPWTEELAGYRPWGHKESDMTEVTEHAACTQSYL